MGVLSSCHATNNGVAFILLELARSQGRGESRQNVDIQEKSGTMLRLTVQWQLKICVRREKFPVTLGVRVQRAKDLSIQVQSAGSKGSFGSPRRGICCLALVQSNLVVKVANVSWSRHARCEKAEGKKPARAGAACSSRWGLAVRKSVHQVNAIGTRSLCLELSRLARLGGGKWGKLDCTRRSAGAGKLDGVELWHCMVFSSPFLYG